MNQNTKSEARNAAIDLSISFRDITNKIDILENFFKTNYKIQEDKLKDIKTKYKIGLKLDEEMSTFFYGKEKIENVDFEEFKKSIIFDDIRIEDIIEIIYEDGQVGFSHKKGFEAPTYNPMISRRELEKCQSGMDILNNSVLSNIIIIFEEYLKSCYFKFIYSNPKLYFENKQIPIIKIFTEKYVITNIINEEIDNALRDSLKCLDTIINKNNINIDAFEKIKDSFIEIYQRRNLLVHNNGIINETYLNKIPSSFSKNLKLSRKIKTDYNYIENAFEVLIKIISCLCFNMSQIFNKETIQEELADYAFNCLSNEKYGISKYIYSALVSDKKIEFASRLNYQCNYLNSLKHLGENITSKLEELDVSATTDNYKIAKLCLSSKYDQVFELLKKTYPNSFGAKEIREWPIFVDFRKTKYYEEFVKLHESDFEQYDYIDR